MDLFVGKFKLLDLLAVTSTESVSRVRYCRPARARQNRRFYMYGPRTNSLNRIRCYAISPLSPSVHYNFIRTHENHHGLATITSTYARYVQWSDVGVVNQTTKLELLCWR